MGSIERPLQGWWRWERDVDNSGGALKNGKARVVLLSGPALSIVVDLVKRSTALAGEHSPPQFVFVSPNDPKKPIDGHTFSVAMTRFGNALRTAADFKDCGSDEARAVTTWTSDRPSAHDLRRTLATRLAGSGIPAEDVSACLNHTRRSITARHYDLYDRAREKRRAFDLWAEQVTGIIGQGDQSGEGSPNNQVDAPNPMTIVASADSADSVARIDSWFVFIHTIAWAAERSAQPITAPAKALAL
jgi:hypothetical protein